MSTLERTVRTEIKEAIHVPNLELLVRLGFMPLKDLFFLRRALDRLHGGVMLTPADRDVLSRMMTKLLQMTMGNPAIFNQLRMQVTKESLDMDVVESMLIEIRDELLKKIPDGMLDTIATNVKSKLGAGGKISPEDKRAASKAKSELRRRRDNKKHKMKNESYEKVFQQVLSNYGVDSLNALPAEHTKEFFQKVETLYKSGE